MKFEAEFRLLHYFKSDKVLACWLGFFVGHDLYYKSN